jgi:thymidylate kinase
MPRLAEANNVYELRYTGALVNYLYNTCFSPTKSDFLKAFKKGHFLTWPGLTEEAINIYLKMMPATAMVRMNQRRQTIRSTSKEIKSEMEEKVVTPVTSQ